MESIGDANDQKPRKTNDSMISSGILSAARNNLPSTRTFFPPNNQAKLADNHHQAPDKNILSGA